eukprot:352193-Chlamydomonas_euryale.AAC.10
MRTLRLKRSLRPSFVTWWLPLSTQSPVVDVISARLGRTLRTWGQQSIVEPNLWQVHVYTTCPSCQLVNPGRGRLASGKAFDRCALIKSAIVFYICSMERQVCRAVWMSEAGCSTAYKPRGVMAGVWHTASKLLQDGEPGMCLVCARASYIIHACEEAAQSPK